MPDQTEATNDLAFYDYRRQDLKNGVYEPEIIFSSSENMSKVADNSVQLIVTSPPYNVGKNYGVYDDSKTRKDYLDYLDSIWSECRRVLCKGGRIAVNVANLKRRPYDFICADIVTRLQDRHKFLMRGDIIWNKGASVGVSTAWGSWRSASNPTLRDLHEHILVFCKDDWSLQSDNHVTTISPKEFCWFTRSVWDMNTVRAPNGHPAPFPLDLPARLIKLYTYVNDLVLDPFLGSGTTCVAAKSLARRSVGYEIDPSYKQVIENRLAAVKTLAFRRKDIKFNGKPLEERMGKTI